MMKTSKIVVAGLIMLSSFSVFDQTANAYLLCTQTFPTTVMTHCGVCPPGESGNSVFDVLTKTNTVYCEVIALTTTTAINTTTTTATNTTTTTATNTTNAPTTNTTTATNTTNAPTTNTTTAPTITVRPTTTTTEVQAVLDDGESEDDFAEIGLKITNQKFDIRISSSFVDTEMMMRAYKKGSKSVTWRFTTNKNGSYRIITKRPLKGFTVSIWVDAEKWDSLRVR